ncbi:BAG domain-containing protein Samui isoform X2 [Ceratina calcarata]|uniref:BAG domain-containing protein Samui isoform X2 n=1 Tax=Ceratina calcarata TaxID=156304 RepID=A0AAJ7J542_9HYME|nr:BAG domain-containing protein Samui isoform X2 [Ceratina calcarata]XP_017884710.1 BAG domain-containing protein Samui isoform X2 [Ceratina calcarata]
MDSPVVVDKASEFGDPIDLDRPFPAFPFDDDNFGRRSDIRAHLDDLAARHPELAEHLLGPPWGDVPFHGSFRNRNRANDNYSSNDNGQQQQQSHGDEDAKSQASGSSAGSSYEEPDNRNQQEREEQNRNRKIPQYGLRNTVDIGQHRHNMENPDKGNRNQRSMSAPPENRQSDNQQQPQQQQDQTQPQQGQRYVSRIDITPQHNQPPPQQQQPPSQQQQKPQQQSNVRHIPIFVEGRDEPVLPRSFAEEAPYFRREPSPTQFSTPPHFPRHDSSFGSRFGGRHHQWPPHFQDSFYPASSTFENPPRKQQQQHYEQPRQQPKQTQQHDEQPKQQWQKPEQKQAEQQEAAPPKPKPTLPKDPLERVALVQKEVDSLAEQVNQYTGNSRTDKQYIYLDEMLTRELIKLDDIETEGRENVRQARKNAIRTIQETISLLESKAPLVSRQTSMEEQARCEDQEEKSKTEEEARPEVMDIDQKSDGQNKEAIPLPPGPSSPTKPSEESEQSSAEKATEDTERRQQEEPMDTGTTPATSSIADSSEQSSEQTNLTEEKENAEKKEELTSEGGNSEKVKNVFEEIKPENVSSETEAEAKPEKVEDTQKTEEKMDVDSSEVKQSSKSSKTSKSPKKGKKTKKQTPVSDTPIPLPAPDNAEANTK